VWQNASASVTPASPGTLSQLKKQYFMFVDSKGEHTCGYPVRHSPGTAQQSASVEQTWVQ
jgi:hypothetical protein